MKPMINSAENLKALVKTPMIPPEVQLLAQKGVKSYQSGKMASLKTQRQNEARAGGRLNEDGFSPKEGWIQDTLGANEEVLVEQLKEIPAPPTFSCQQVSEALTSFPKTGTTQAKPNFYVVDGVSVNYLHDAPSGKNSILMLASQADFNEAPGAIDADVTDWASDPTQGPQGSIESVASALHRKAAKRNGSLPHALTKVIPEVLLKKYDQPYPKAALYRDGYLNPSVITDEADKKLLLAEIKKNIGNLTILPQWAICESSNATQLQVFTFAPAYQGKTMPAAGSIDDQICQELVVAQYRAIAQLAVMRARQTGQTVPLHLTLVGQGAFKNRPEVMVAAMRVVAEIVKGEKVQVYVHAYTNAKAIEAQLASMNTAVTFDSMTKAQFKTHPHPAAAQIPQAAEVKEQQAQQQAQPSLAARGAPPPSKKFLISSPPTHEPPPKPVLPTRGPPPPSRAAHLHAQPQPTTQTLTLYSAAMSASEAGKHRLAVKFPSKEARERFEKEFGEAAQQSGVVIRVSTIPNAPEVLYIEPSQGKGSCGTYASANGELSVNFGNNQLREFFLQRTGITAKQALIIDNADSIYFDKAQLPPAPDKTKNIQTTVEMTELSPKSRLKK